MLKYFGISRSTYYARLASIKKGDKYIEEREAIRTLQGWQYQHSSYQKTLKNHAIIQSMSRKGNCLNNSVMENFFGLLKSELLYLEEFTSYEDFINKLIDYINYYNTKRIKLKS